MTVHETRDCVIFGLRNQIWNNTEAKTFGVWWCRIQEFIVNCAGFRGEIISSFLVCTNCPKNTGNYIVEEWTKYWTHVGNTRSDVHNKSLELNGWKAQGLLLKTSLSHNQNSEKFNYRTKDESKIKQRGVSTKEIILGLCWNLQWRVQRYFANANC